jgi:hypothetical protein
MSLEDSLVFGNSCLRLPAYRGWHLLGWEWRWFDVFSFFLIRLLIERGHLSNQKVNGPMHVLPIDEY